MSRRTRRTLLIVAAVLVLLALAVFLRSKAPPEAARLLPESDGIVYVNFAPVRAFAHFRKLQPPRHVPDYQDFIDATGIDWERDVDQVAIGLKRMQDPNGPNGPVAYSMVITGKITGQKLNAWLDAHATSRENYTGHTIYSIPSESRTVRVAQVGYDMIGVSNYPTPEMIHSILDRHRTAALPFAGSSLLQQHFHDVPLLSLVWGVGQIGLPFNESGNIRIFGFDLPLASDSTIVASAAPVLSVHGSLGSVQLRVEEIAANEDTAASQAAALGTLVTVARGFTVPPGSGKAKAALQQLLKSAEVSQHGERVVVTATLPGSSLTGL
jgi:hypothetical protein